MELNCDSNISRFFRSSTNEFYTPIYTTKNILLWFEAIIWYSKVFQNNTVMFRTCTKPIRSSPKFKRAFSLIFNGTKNIELFIQLILKRFKEIRRDSKISCTYTNRRLTKVILFYRL